MFKGHRSHDYRILSPLEMETQGTEVLYPGPLWLLVDLPPMLWGCGLLKLGEGPLWFRISVLTQWTFTRVAFLSKLLQYCGQLLLTHPNLRGGTGGGRLSLQTKPVTSSFCFVLWTIFQLVFFGLSSVGFSSFPVSEVPWPSTGLLGRYASAKVWNLLLFWKHFPLCVGHICLPNCAFNQVWALIVFMLEFK